MKSSGSTQPKPERKPKVNVDWSPEAPESHKDKYEVAFGVWQTSLDDADDDYSQKAYRSVSRCNLARTLTTAPSTPSTPQTSASASSSSAPTPAPTLELQSPPPDTHFKITLRRSAISLGDKIKGTLKSLGIHRRFQTVYFPFSPEVAGKILRVKELVEVENVPTHMVMNKQQQRQARKATRGYKVVGSRDGFMRI
ncbi:hypothetical protein NLJ89_g6564 [Agrocybe chaxingu]|uniref:Large ribosomal subunit protein uL30m n=1 Tax=Agrocybe chaxingu TaxID=84603 RepID=A0A9W8K5B1_9AGAR|nr:hypothetical protein NLJ89_g6564 [Agrocybe chaxingu]